MRCPACFPKGHGAWGSRWDPSPRPDGENAGRCIENEAELRERWPLYDAPRKARDSQVWWCHRCGGWTWDPVAIAVEAQPYGDVMRTHEDRIGVDGETLLARYVQASAWWRRRHGPQRTDNPADDDLTNFPALTGADGCRWIRPPRQQ